MRGDFGVVSQRRVQVTVRWPRGRDIQACASVLPVAIDAVYACGVAVVGGCGGWLFQSLSLGAQFVKCDAYLQAACGQLAADQV